MLLHYTRHVFALPLVFETVIYLPSSLLYLPNFTIRRVCIPLTVHFACQFVYYLKGSKLKSSVCQHARPTPCQAHDFIITRKTRSLVRSGALPLIFEFVLLFVVITRETNEEDGNLAEDSLTMNFLQKLSQIGRRPLSIAFLYNISTFSN